MKSYLKLFNNHQSSTGFTLIELLVAMAITSIVVTIAGFGLVAIMERDGKEQGETARRVELNRALDLIADDIRMATSVEVASSYSISPVSPACAVPTPVLYLTVPSSSVNNILYYFNDISNCTGNTTGTKSVWLKPAVIKRDKNVTGTTVPGGNGTELVDAITNVDITPNCPADLPNVSPTPDANGKVKGFYACTSSSNSRVVELHLLGKLTDAYGNSLTPYEVSTRVFARSITPPPPPPAPATPAAPAAPAAPTTCTVPSIVGTNTNGGDSAVRTAITNANLVPSGTSVTSGHKEVQSQSPSANTSVACSSTVSYTYKD